MEKLNEYYDRLKNALNSGVDFEERNFDRSHNAMVMRLMLENSEEIFMFCGEMSIFRKSFYDEIRKKSQEEGDRLEEMMRQALSNFLDKKKAKINIILQNYSTDYFDTLIVDKNRFLKNAKIYALPMLEYDGYKESVKQINHFSYTKDRRISRWEVDMTEHEANVAIGPNQEPTEIPMRIFNVLKKGALQIN